MEDPRIKDFLQYLKNKTPTNDFTRRLDQMVEELKIIEMGFSDYIAARQKEFDWLRQGKEQGFEEGLQQGIEQGLERGAYQNKLETARTFLSMGLSPEQVAQGTKLPLDVVQSVMESCDTSLSSVTG